MRLRVFVFLDGVEVKEVESEGVISLFSYYFEVVDNVVRWKSYKEDELEYTIIYDPASQNPPVKIRKMDFTIGKNWINVYFYSKPE